MSVQLHFLFSHCWQALSSTVTGQLFEELDYMVSKYKIEFICLADELFPIMSNVQVNSVKECGSIISGGRHSLGLTI